MTYFVKLVNPPVTLPQPTLLRQLPYNLENKIQPVRASMTLNSHTQLLTDGIKIQGAKPAPSCVVLHRLADREMIFHFTIGQAM